MVTQPPFARQRRQISNYWKEIIEEKALNESLLSRLKDHAEYTMNFLNGISSSELFATIFVSANSSLSKYIQILIEINCKLEALLNKEINQWNTIQSIDSPVTIKPFLSNENKKEPDEVNVNQAATTRIPVKPKEDAATSEMNTSTIVSNVKNLNCQVSTETEQPQNNDNKKKSGTLQILQPDISTISQRGGTENISEKSCPAITVSPHLKITDKTNNTSIEKTAKKKQVNQNNKSSDKNNKEVEKNKSKIAENSSSQVTVTHKNVLSSNIKSSKSKNNQIDVEKRELLEGVKLSHNEIYYGNIIHAVSPLELYIKFETDAIKSNLLEEQLQKFAKTYNIPSKVCKEKTIELKKMAIKKEIGNYALLYSQGVFHRVKVLDWKFNHKVDLVTVHLIDSGEKKKVSVYSLYPMPNKFMNYPAVVRKCYLAYLPKGCVKNPKTMEYIQNIKSGIIRIKILKDQQRPGSYPVIIHDKNNKHCLNQLIVDEIHLNGLRKWDPMSEAYKSTMNMYEFNHEDPAAVIYGYVGKDYERVCKFYGATGKCYKSGCRKEHVPFDSKGYTTDKEEVFIRALNQLQIPSVNVLKVRVTHVVSLASFYCIMDKSESDEETLFSLQSSMNKNISTMKKLLVPPGVGQIVVAKQNNRSCYRARVVCVLPEKDESTLFYVDYGTVQNVHLSNIRAIEPCYLHLPFQAIFCEISGIGETNDTLPSTLDFLNRVLKGVCSIEIVSTLPGEQTHLLVNLFTSEGKNVADLLLTKKLVSQKENIVVDDNKKYLPG